MKARLNIFCSLITLCITILCFIMLIFAWYPHNEEVSAGGITGSVTDKSESGELNFNGNKDEDENFKLLPGEYVLLYYKIASKKTISLSDLEITYTNNSFSFNNNGEIFYDKTNLKYINKDITVNSSTVSSVLTAIKWCGFDNIEDFDIDTYLADSSLWSYLSDTEVSFTSETDICGICLYFDPEVYPKFKINDDLFVMNNSNLFYNQIISFSILLV